MRSAAANTDSQNIDRQTDGTPFSIALRVLRVAALLYKRAIADDLPAMASALAYKTLLGLIPILVVVTLVAKTLMGAQFAPFVARFIASLGLDQMKIVPPSDGTGPAAAPVELGSWVETLVKQASEVDLSALGWVGVTITVASAIWLMTSVELSFNRIYHARQGRTWVRRVILYWFVLTASPLLIAAIPLLSALLHGAEGTAGIGWLLSLFGTVWTFAILWALLMTVYLVVPAARVGVKSAAIGAFFASATIIGLKGLLAAYFEHAFGMSRLYGSLGLVPIFMFWMWVVWLTVLGGLQVSAFAQTISVRGLDAGTGADDESSADPILMVAVMEQSIASWQAGHAVNRESIATNLNIDDRLAGEHLEELVRANFLMHTERDLYVPARPPETIGAGEVLEAALARCAGEEGIERSRIAATIRAAQMECAERLQLTPGRMNSNDSAR